MPQVNFYIDGVIADQKVAYESGKVASVGLTLGGRADTNADHVVDVFDLAEVAARFNSRVTPGDPADVNGDGVVNILDLTKVGMRFGRNQP
ncbi:MAG: dockerin type I domain-containing protein [Dehalococcoidia bacterium]|nr:dockerin type I domain-containing protein [Dehalococcoidia bacterium]